MGKRQMFDENGEAQEVEKKDDSTENKFRFRKYGTKITKDLKAKQHFFVSYDECLKLIKCSRNKGLSRAIVKYNYVRHVSLPYHMSSNVAMKEAINFLAEGTVGKYKDECRGVVVAAGKPKIVSPPRVIGDQFTFHLDVLVPQIVFVPKNNDVYEAKVKRVDGGLIYAVVFGMITIHMEQSIKAASDDINFNDTILVKYTGIQIKDALCHLQGKYVGLVKKGPKVKTEKGNSQLPLEEEMEEQKYDVELNLNVKKEIKREEAEA